MKKFWLGLLLCVLISLQGAVADEAKALWPKLETEIKAAIEDGQTSGAVLLVGRGEKLLYHAEFGEFTKDQLFDTASLTKPLVTALACHILAQEEKLDFQRPVQSYLPMAKWGDLKVRHLLTHSSGLPAVVRPEGLPASLLAVRPKTSPGEEFLYSDVGYLVLQQIVEKQSGMPLDEFFQRRIAEPLELESAGFRPASERCVPTFGVPLGTVHDPIAQKLKGVAGHAGLFASAYDVHRLLSRSRRLLTSRSQERWLQSQELGRTFGMDADTQYSSARGHRFSPLTSAGHTGFTGCSFWWDKPSGLHVILMASRLHPDNQGNVIPLRRKLATLVGEHLLGTQVRTGLDQLVSDGFHQLKGKKVGFVVNHTSRDRFGRHLTELLPRKREFELVSLFTPEHGLLGVRDEPIEHGHHQELGVPIYSLYGKTRQPEEEWFRNLDTLVLDLQDVGVRYYTYISTLKACLEVAKSTGVRVVVLDRPNPLGGKVVDGHIAQEFSFIACDALPLVHGMTIGEVGGYLNRQIGASFEVIKMEGWDRSMRWPDTGLPILPPSPNLAEWESVQLYPVLGQLEWCDLSVGRGTNSPFRILGAPFIKDPQTLATILNQGFEGRLNFTPRYFVPQSSKFQGQLCGGVEVRALRDLPRPAGAGRDLARALKLAFPQHIKLEDMSRHLGAVPLPQAFETEPDSEGWKQTRAPYLLY